MGQGTTAAKPTKWRAATQLLTPLAGSRSWTLHGAFPAIFRLRHRRRELEFPMEVLPRLSRRDRRVKQISRAAHQFGVYHRLANRTGRAASILVADGSWQAPVVLTAHRGIVPSAACTVGY